ncbi:hypothetical protein K0A96_01175 [Patescibacteria group bacterium]|nr:hypothetical protein [Patescibacteria group bacterium]
MRERKRKNFQKSYKSNVIFGKSSFLSVGIILCASFLVISQIKDNSLNAKEQNFEEIKVSIVQLEEERDRLQIEATRLQSIQEIEKTLNDDSSTKDKYVPVDKINYLPSSNVAVK